MNRNERREQQARNRKSTSNPLGVGRISQEEAFARMTGTGAGMKDVTIDEVPDDLKNEMRAYVDDMNKNGQGPARIVRKPDGSYSVFGAIKTSQAMRQR